MIEKANENALIYRIEVPLPDKRLNKSKMVCDRRSYCTFRLFVKPEKNSEE